MRVDITKNTINKEIKGLKGAGPAAVREFVQSMTMATHKAAVQGIQRGPASGRIYPPIRGIRGAPHQASAPGEYPMSDTGRLAASVKFELPTSDTKPEGYVGTNLIYGKYLEFKDPSRGGRPWLLRAFNETTERAEQILTNVFKRRAKRGK